MKVKNNTNKPIGIGVLNLLPGQTETLPAPYENHPVVKMLATKKYDKEHTFITLINEKAVAQTAAPAQGADNGNSEDNNNGSEDNKTYSLSALKRLGKAKLEEMAKEAGIVVEDPTNEKLAEALFAAQGADNGSDE